MIIKRGVPWYSRSLLSRCAHVVERLGLALTGSACGLFVAGLSAFVDMIGSAEVVLAMMIYGAAGFYLGIDLPRIRRDQSRPALRQGVAISDDALELLTAAGTLLAAAAAVVSVFSIVLGETLSAATATILFLSWAIGATMQIAAGIIARIKLARAVETAKLALFFQ